MPKLLFTTSSFNLDNFKHRDSIESAGFQIVLNPYGKRLTETQVTELLDDQVVAMVAGVEPITKSAIQKATSLKVISRCGIGLDNIDLEFANLRGISVFNTPDAPTRAVTELTLGHIFSLARHITECDRAIRNNNWQPIMGSLISMQTIGIIGYGRIGKMVAEYLHNIGARILVHDISQVNVEDYVEIETLENLLTKSDIISLHIPYGSSTHHLINKNTLALMKPTALIINVARGGLIDEDAILMAIQKNKLGGAALDCFSEEPYAGELLKCEKIQMTAHMGSYAKETRAIMETEACNALINGLRQHGLY